MNTLKLIILLLAAFGLASLLSPVVVAVWKAGEMLFIPLMLAAGAALMYTATQALLIWRELRPGRRMS
jgi:uncharacterized membrane protein YqjE